MAKSYRIHTNLIKAHLTRSNRRQLIQALFKLIGVFIQARDKDSPLYSYVLVRGERILYYVNVVETCVTGG